MIFAPRKRPKRYPALEIHGAKIQIRIKNARNFVKKEKIELVLESETNPKKHISPVKLGEPYLCDKITKR